LWMSDACQGSMRGPAAATTTTTIAAAPTAVIAITGAQWGRSSMPTYPPPMQTNRDVQVWVGRGLIVTKEGWGWEKVIDSPGITPVTSPLLPPPSLPVMLRARAISYAWGPCSVFSSWRNMERKHMGGG
jgi:hypothetical protein